jgi:hypothetical protein
MSNDNASPLTFDAALDAFVAKIDAVHQAYNDSKRNIFPEGYYEKIVLEPGSRFIRVVHGCNGSRSVYCFVEKGTGNILKGAGWKAPAKGARGNIFNPETYAAADCNTGWLYRR